MNRQAREWLQPWSDWRRKRFWLLVAVVAWTLFGFFGAPPLVERALTQAIEKTGRSIDVADIHTNPYALSLRVSGLEIRDPDATPIVGFEELYVNFQLSSIFRWAWTFDEIRLVDLHLDEERFNDGSTRLARLSEDLTAPPEGDPTPPPEAEGPPRLVIHNLTLRDGSFSITDQMAGGFQTRFGPVSVSANDLRTVSGDAGDNAVSITTPEGGIISWQGDLQLVPLASSGHLTVKGKGLPAALRYADHFLPASIQGEEVDMGFDYSLEVGPDGPRVAVDNLRTQTGAIQVVMDGAEDPFLGLGDIRVTGGSIRWPEQTARVESLMFNALEVDAWLDENGALNLSDAIPADDEAVDEPSAADGDGSWFVSLNRIELANAAIDFEDRTLPEPGRVRIENLGLTLSEVDNRDETVIPTQLSLDLASGGELDYTGSIVALPEFRLDGKATVSGLALPAFQAWLAQIARVEIGAGTLDLQASVKGAPSTAVLEGSTSIKGLALQDTFRDQQLAALETMDIEQFELDLAASALRTSPVALKGAYGRVHIYEDLTTNLDGLTVEDSDSAGVPAADGGESPADEMQITIAGIDVEDGALDFADDSLPLPFSASIRSLDGNLSALSTTSREPSAVKLEGQVNEYGEARIEGKLNPWDFTQSADIDVIFRNLRMSNLTPYTLEYAGYAIEEGRLDLDLSYILDQRQLQGENEVVIRELELGEKIETPDGTSLPLKLAVALLKDSEGVIDIEFPVSGNLDDPTFELSGIVWKAIGNLITRIVTSPFRFLGSLVGVDSEDFGTLSFQPGQADVSPQDREQLSKLTDAMRARPELSLVVNGVYSEALDRPALAQQAFEARLETQRAAMLESGASEALDPDRLALEAMFSEAFPDTPIQTVRTEFTTSSASQEIGEQDGEEDGEEDLAPVIDGPAYIAALRKRLIDEETVEEADLVRLATARAEAIVATLRPGGAPGGDAGADSSGDSGGDSSNGSGVEAAPLDVAVSDAVKAVEASDGAVELKLDVDVREAGDL